jgi:hypothetical protein
MLNLYATRAEAVVGPAQQWHARPEQAVESAHQNYPYARFDAYAAKGLATM